MTTLGKVLGTPHYLSPEAIQEPQAIDARTDLYALGAVGYYLLAGRPPFVGDEVGDVIVADLNTDVVADLVDGDGSARQKLITKD